MKNVTILLAVLAVAAMVATPAYADRIRSKDVGTFVWDATPTSSNWYDYGTGLDHAPPVSGDRVEIMNNATPQLNNALNLGGGQLSVGIYGLGNLEINNDFANTNTFDVGYQSGDSGTCLVTHNSGTVTLGYHVKIANNSNAGKTSYAKYTINGGTIAQRSDRGFAVGYNTGGTTSHSYGTFEVDGGGADSIGLGVYTQNAESTLAFIFDGDADPIQQVDVAGNATLAGTLKITGTADAGTYTIMTYGGSLSGTWTEDLSAGWSVAYGTDSVTATYVIPEPATMSLLVIGGIGVLIRRRKK